MVKAFIWVCVGFILCHYLGSAVNASSQTARSLAYGLSIVGELTPVRTTADGHVLASCEVLSPIAVQQIAAAMIPQRGR